MTRTRDSLADIAERLNGDMGDDEAMADDASRIAQLRKVGSK